TDFNLIGNPYPSAIFAPNFINSNPNISGELYFWTHTTSVSVNNPGPAPLNYTANDYAVLNLLGGVASVSGSLPPSNFIPSHTGFMVEADSAGSVVFDNSLRNEGYVNYSIT